MAVARGGGAVWLPPPLLESVAAVFISRLGVKIAPVAADNARYDVLAEVDLEAPADAPAGARLSRRRLSARCSRRVLRIAGAAALRKPAPLAECMEEWAMLWRAVAEIWCADASAGAGHGHCLVQRSSVVLAETAEAHPPRYSGAAICHFDFCGETLCAVVKVRD